MTDMTAPRTRIAVSVTFEGGPLDQTTRRIESTSHEYAPTFFRIPDENVPYRGEYRRIGMTKRMMWVAVPMMSVRPKRRP